MRSIKKSLWLLISALSLFLFLAAFGQQKAEKKVLVEKVSASSSYSSSSQGSNSEDLQKLVQFLSQKSYDGATKQYKTDDIKIPKSLIEPLTNLNLSYIQILRQEIFARRGDPISMWFLKEIFQKTTWYKESTNISLEANLSEVQKNNINYLGLLDKIDRESPKETRQLAVLFNFTKEEMTTDEAIKVYKALKDPDWLNKVSKPEIKKYSGKNNFQFENNLVQELEKTGDIAKREKLMREFYNRAFQFIENFNKGDRLYLGVLPNGFQYVLEVVIKSTNFILEAEGGEIKFPYSFDADEEGNVWLSLLDDGLTKYDYYGNPVTTFFRGFYNTHFIKVINKENKVIAKDSSGIFIMYYNLTQKDNWWGNKDIGFKSSEGKLIEDQYLRKSQSDQYGNRYAYDGFDSITVNDGPSLLVKDPGPPNIKRFAVTPNGDIYFRWVIGMGKEKNLKKYYVLFRAKNIGRGY